MNTAKEKLIDLIKQMPESEIVKVLDFAEYLMKKQEKQLVQDLSKASETSTDFWDNETDDEVWNHV
ncbi:hypothetical protein H839_12349 [Parageobacillus genomosp. 1]|jgi:predicted Zn-ribbon and HTH transcriptional regulator|uniref:DUF2281 domain-containing protein n=1 Tax=Parageobacillus genomosp. 1 TaxID=1295642 RepID=A0ABC9VCL1_9BACL|nr:DUF2281 domain-containing protein [Parageobacillus genomosp. 1]EZP76065.1 hypothetical protein H839_12349 [Parageobacillus genomosp. 1]